jgi:hypothetical protein
MQSYGDVPDKIYFLFLEPNETHKVRHSELLNVKASNTYNYHYPKKACILCLLWNQKLYYSHHKSQLGHPSQPYESRCFKTLLEI